MDINELPVVSIVMPVYNESAYIDRSLKAILAQDYPASLLEVIVADGGSKDNTKDIIAGFVQGMPAVRMIDNPDRYMPMGFNRALKYARGEVIIMLGGHVEIASDYVSTCVRLLYETSAVCVGGSIENVAVDRVSKSIAAAMGSVFGVGNSAFRTRPNATIETDTAVFGAYHSSVFSSLGGLDEEMIRNQDDEFNYRLRKKGGRILFTPEIRSSYYNRTNFVSLWNQYFQYGYYKVRVFQKHPFQMSVRQFVPPVFVVGLLASSVSLFFPAFWYFSLLLPAFYLLSTLVVSTGIAARKGFDIFLYLPIAFAILHISYGCGFLLGLVKFWNRWGDKVGLVPEFSGE
ncbi:MAG: glycosyltransferase family 2 protein [Anaerolineales bacterium]|nr:glycosyltransferase family 2 protein [Anaerolineales bacterium]